MRRCPFLLALILLLTFMASCVQQDPAPDASEADIRASSLTCLSEAMPLDVPQAEALLDLLTEQGMAGEVLFAYPATDDADKDYYHVWIGETTVDVYLQDGGGVAAISKAGVVIFGELPAPDAPSDAEPPPDENGSGSTSTTITLDSHTAKVAPGNMGKVSVFGTPGEQYKIKVYYAGGVSSAKALAPLVAREDGSLVWEWKVSSQVKPGVYKIEVVHAENNDDRIVLPFEVVDITEE